MVAIEARNDYQLNLYPNGGSATLQPILGVGPPGADGAASTVPGPPGTFSNNFKGAWSSVTAYAAGDIVTNAGSSWLAKVNSTNVTPVEGASWTVVAAKGTDGAGSGTVTSVNSVSPVSGNVTLAASDVGAVPTTRTVNGKALSSNISIAAADVGAPSGSGTSSGTNTGDQTSVTGNAGTATKLATARNIDGQAFDGTAAITVIAPGTVAAAAKTTPVDADLLPLVDSAASNVLKKLSWANLKATLVGTFMTATGGGKEVVATAATGNGTKTLDLSTANIFPITTMTGAVTIAFSNPPASGTCGTFQVEIVQDSTLRAITWPTIKWAGGSAPTQVASKTCLAQIQTRDGGTTYYGSGAIYG